MCEDCPAEVRDLADRLAAYIGKHNYAIAGGLHVVIEDENVIDDDIKWCVEHQELDPESRQFAAELLAMPVPYRHAAVKFAWDDRERERWANG